ncbi:hypothetical protein [Phenylobacterium sp.]|jgi:hypothetical protein|uniref:hypothetical protein n=1 Tax=Phenylobacterium sp. TaxID=1871053 RepID=UPI002F944B4D
MKTMTLGLMALGLSAAAAPAGAQAVDADGDLRCAAVAYYMYATDEKPSDEGFNAVMYFLGRAQAHAGGEFRARLVKEIAGLEPAKAVPEINRCAELYVKGATDLEAALPDILKAMKRSGD